MERKLLALCLQDRKAWETVKKLEADTQLSKQSKIALDVIGEYYAKDATAINADKELICEQIIAKYPKHIDLFKAMFDKLEVVSVPNMVEHVLSFRKSAIRAEIAAAIAINAKEEVIDELYHKLKAVSNIDNLTDIEQEATNNKPLSAIIEKNSGGNLIKLAPDALNEAAGGGMLRGHHVLIFARPDAGKTTTALTLVRGFMKQGLKVLYIGNEDPEDDVLLRFAISLSGKTKDYVLNNEKEVWDILQKRNYANFYYKEMWPGTIGEIEQQVKIIQPDVLIVDQARNISTGKENRVLELETVERNIRNLGKRYKMLTISFTQAGDSGDNKAVLQMGDVDSSNTGMQASADLMVGVGCTRDMESRGIRMLSFPKNKRGSKEPRQVKFLADIQRLE